jgi:Domain of unknown function (DUF1735)
MKQIQIKALLLSLVIVSLSSCLKESRMNIDTSKGQKNMIEFANTGVNEAEVESLYPRFNTDLGRLESGASATFNVNINYSGMEMAPSDITVSLALDEAFLNKFNEQNETEYEIPASEIYSFPASAVIKKGTRSVQVQVKVTRTANFDFDAAYGLPLSITSASTGTISGNFGKALYSFSVRNVYDGVYKMEATKPMVDLTSAGLTGYYPLNMHLITFSANSIALYNEEENYDKGYYHLIKSGSSTSAYGSFSPVFYFDNTGKITSVSNEHGQNSGGNKRSAVINPDGVNQATFNADGSIKSFEVSYIMTQNGSPRTYFYEKFTYLRER